MHTHLVCYKHDTLTLCITLDLIWRKQQVVGKIAFYFQTKTCCLLKTKSNVCNLKKVFLSRKTCSNAAHQLVDGLLLLCKVMKARYHYVYQHNDRLKINLHSLHWYSVDLLQTFILKLELAKYYKDSEMTAFISERSRNSK